MVRPKMKPLFRAPACQRTAARSESARVIFAKAIAERQHARPERIAERANLAVRTRVLQPSNGHALERGSDSDELDQHLRLDFVLRAGQRKLAQQARANQSKARL